MPVLFQHLIKRSDLRRNFDPDRPEQNVLYVFGDNVKREGLGGQARVMRLEPNSVGVATKYSPNHRFGETAREITVQKRIIDQDMKPLFEHVKLGGVVVWPARGIGMDRADLPTYAPTTYDYIESKLAALIRVSKLFQRGATEDRIDAEAEGHL